MNLALLLHSTLAFASGGADVSLWEEITNLWATMGIVGRGVWICLGLMLLAAVITGVERAIAFSTAKRHSITVRDSIVKYLRAGDVASALKLTQREDLKTSYLGALLRSGLLEVSERLDAEGIENAQIALDKSIGEEMAKLKRGMTVLATVGSTAPFVGLFGTVFGVIHAFEAMSEGDAGLGSVSTAIAEALYATGWGIFVAIVGVWLFNYFNLRTEKVNAELVASEADFINWARKRVQSVEVEAAK